MRGVVNNSFLFVSRPGGAKEAKKAREEPEGRLGVPGSTGRSQKEGQEDYEFQGAQGNALQEVCM